MAFTNNNENSSTSGNITSAEISKTGKEYKEKSESYSKVDEKIIECDKLKCQYNIENGKCSLDFCFYDKTEWEPVKETFKFNCQICDTETEGDIRNPDMRICDHCLSRMKEMGTVKNCKICTGAIDPKKIILWGTGICDICAIRLKSVLTREDRRCPICDKKHKAMPLPLTNICSQCVSDIKKAIEYMHRH